ncbi:MAG TPA: hypothetical protein VN894_18060 [Polyangiaceae bacterium]|nr:hypothetical protein [Polyangiaceae bacterium]
MTIADISGTFDSTALSRLKFPIAWSGTPDSDYEADLRALVAEAREALAHDVDAVSVEIVNGEITSVVTL